MDLRGAVRMDGPVLAFGGHYGNLEAIALRAEARRRAIPARGKALRPSSLFRPAVVVAA
jgi:hypothetical protein